MTALLSIPLPRPDGLASDQAYPTLLQRLSEMSVRKQFDPYRDVDWDAPEHRLEPEDPRLRIPHDHPLAATAWYRQLSPPEQTRFGREWIAQSLRYATSFEAVLSRGLLRFAQSLPNAAPEYRYAMHEVVEEGRHSIMFQELINRLGCDPRPVSGLDAAVDDLVARSAARFPCMFLFCVLGGEIFIDQQNRELLARDRAKVHPLVRRVMQIHVIEEARHVCFAESYLRAHLASASSTERALIAWLVPLAMHDPMRMMLIPNRRLCREFGLPPLALREAFGPGTRHRQLVKATAEPIHRLCREHGLARAAHERWWRRLGLRG